MSTPAFTVVLAAFNEEEWVARAIRSVQAQTRDDFELIVVDDGSTDSTAEVVRGLQSDPRIRLISQENRGLAASLNVAAAAGSAPYISLIDADDLWMPTYLQHMGGALDADPGAGFSYTDGWVLEVASNRFWRVTSNTHTGEPDPLPSEPEEFLRLLIGANFIFGLATIRRAAFERVGGFNDSLQASEDYELWIRLLAHGFRAARAPGPLAVVSNRPGAMHTDYSRMLTNAREVYRIVVEDLDTSDEVKGAARRRLAQIDRIQAVLERHSTAAGAFLAVRRRLGRLRRRLPGRRFWYPGTPPDVAAAFPELAEPVDDQAD